MKITRNAFFQNDNQIASLWIVVLILFFKIQLSYLKHDLYGLDHQQNESREKLFQTKITSKKCIFQHHLYNATIPENSVGKTYASSYSYEDKLGIAVYADTEVKYRIIAGDREKFFKAEERIVGDFAFLIIRTRTNNVVLNREKTDEYLLKVKATVNHSDKKISTNCETETSVYIKVLDRNDLSPLFYPTEYSKSIPEDMQLHKSILKVMAEDADLGINGEIYYSFQLDEEYFSIHPTSGVITLTRHLKYAEKSHFDLIVLAHDRGLANNHYNHQGNKAKVTILVEQVNLHVPEIYVKTFSSITKNSNGLVYGRIKVNDKDVGRHGEINKVEIVDGDPDGNFHIKQSENMGEYYIEISRFAILHESLFAYNLTLRAEDKGIPKKYSYKVVPVLIVSQHNQPPIFSKQLYEISIPETSPPNTPVIRLKVTDPDLGKNALVALEIVGGNEGGEFKINPDSGMLYTQKLLDAETKSFYTLTVSAIDLANFGIRKQSSAKVKINVQDMNDNDPIFEQINTTLTINENELAGTFVVKLTAKDKDTGENSYITYSIANLIEVPFEIDHFTGIIKTTALIDYETMQRKYFLSVRASDWGLPYRRQTELELIIEIKDINDNRPQFERVDCVGKIYWNTPVGTDIFTLSAIDFDAKDYITYRIISGNEDGCFNLESTTGILSVACDLTDVGIDRRIIYVSSSDGMHFSDEMSIDVQFVKQKKTNLAEKFDILSGHGAFECRETGVARRLAEILAIAEKNYAKAFDELSKNDLALIPSRYGENLHTPEFYDFPQEIKLNESTKLGETVAIIKARDRDLGYNGKLLYAISDGDYDSVFRIDPENGELQIIGYLDRERQDEYILNITVFDLGQPQKLDSKMLPITILDNNDNQPIFQKSLASFRLTENAVNGTMIFCLNASDADLGKNSDIIYFMQTEVSEFNVNETSGCIFLRSVLDREQKDHYELHIIAKDNGIPPLSSEAVINIFVEDINDNAPTFGAQEFIFKVREDIPKGTVIANIEATDFDFGLNGEIHFLLKEELKDNGLFKIDKYTGVIRTQGILDYETRQIHNLIVSAIDCGTPAFTTDMSIVIEVIDVNENRFSPEFNDFVYVGKIKENVPRGSIVVNITANDVDNNGPDSKISYSIRGGDGLGIFAVNDEGTIRTLCHLDAETKNSYWLTYCAQDYGIVPLSSCVQVNIQIINENDNVPLTDNPVYYQSIPEGSPPNKKIIKLEAVDNDNDPSQKITYKLISGNPEGYFSINSITGEIVTTERKLDRENQPEHILEVSISDNGIPTLTSITRVVVLVEDINDNSPEFDQRFYKIQVPSTVAINESIFQVRATDEDDGVNGQITYGIKSGKGKNKFRIDANTGSIYVSRPLESDTEYEINVKADDNGDPKRSQTTRINVVVISISNKSLHPPVIKTPDSVDITESDRPGFLVALIQATDEDNDHIWYNITDGDDRQEFYIGRDNGNILLAKAMDWETQRSYNLTIGVTDGTHLALSQLFIRVVDTNDNRPQFTQDIYYVNISENIEEESIIMQLHATDADEDKKIFYTLHAAQDPVSLSLFRIDSLTGNVLVTQRLDYEKNAFHNLIVIAKDQGTPAKRNYAKVVITVHDHNDHYPEFTCKIIQRKVPESAAIGSKVAILYALDHDFGRNAEVKYSIISGNIGNMFDMDSSLGIITLAKNLNINQMQEYMLQVRASDMGEPSLSSQIPVHIIVTMSENDPPKFFIPVTTFEIYENIPIGSFINQIEARSSSSIFYEIQSGNKNELFHINPSTGVITTNDYIDYEREKSFNLTVTATNMASASSNHNVIIHVLDVNDNAPIFLQDEYFGEISESSEIGSLIVERNSSKNSPLILKAFDHDAGVNGMIDYNIMDVAGSRFFKVDSSTGTIKLAEKVDYEFINYLTFHVMISDMGIPKLHSKSWAVVRISVLNINDCPPIFEKNEFNVTLYLPTYENVIVTQVNASDADMDENSKLRYDIVDGNSEGCFEINGITGVITTRNVERFSSYYLLHVRASDGLYSTISKVGVIVETSENSGFSFQKSRYEFSTVENSTKLVTVGLVNVIGNLIYENVEFSILNPTKMFQIGTTSGAIKTSGLAFDREIKDNYKLIVEAKSHFSFNKHKLIRRAHVLVDISILDINDNCPMFVNLPYYATVSLDDLKGSLVAKIKAIDLDSFENGEVRYEMKKGNGELFKIDRKTGEITLKQNIEGHNRTYELFIAAYDGGVTPCSTDVTVHVKVVDKSMPIFDKQFYSDNIREDVEMFSALSITIHAESPLRRKLIYTISGGNIDELFEIDYRNGVLYVVNELDFESKKTHDLTIRATDSISGIYAEVEASIKVDDANDCYPKIEKDNYNISIPENLIIGTQILKINATDSDTNANGKLSYFIKNVNGLNNSDHFYIDITDGSLYLKKALNYEEIRSFHLIISVNDHGTPSLFSRANVWIIVKDVNDNAPKFIEPSFSSKLSILALRGQFVLVAKAYDMDYTDNDHLKYKIVDGNVLQTYAIKENTGAIYLQNMLNFTDNHQTLLNVSVTDGIHTSYCRVKITLISENMDSPRFEKLMYESRIKENSVIGSSVIHLKAIDSDSGKYSKLSYSIFSDEMKNYFEIHPLNGSLTSRISFDREKQSFYEVLVKVIDSGGNFGFTVVKIEIEDENDNKPFFAVKEYKISIRANISINSTILKVKATDLDEKQNGFVNYIIENPSMDASHFSIDELDGSLKIVKPLDDYLNDGVFQFFVKAIDNGIPRLDSDVPVTIQIVCSECEIPELEKTVIINVLESTPPGTTLSKLRISGNYSMKFSILTETNAFFITENGEIVLMQTLDREQTDVHFIVALSETKTIPVLYILTEVIVYVLDENDNYPKFDNSIYNAEISENINKGASIIKITATDIDSGPNGDIRYYLENDLNSVYNIFDIDIYTGWITILTKLDREIESEYYCNVLATDNGQPKHVSKIPLIIKILDYNDNPPIFKSNISQIYVNENVLLGTVLFHFIITDLDSEKSDIEYYITDGDNHSQFQIGKTGELFVSRCLDRELISFYNISLLATDGKFTSKAKIFVTVTDVNDNIPICTTPRYNLVINESIAIGTLLLKIVAIDADNTEKEKPRYYLTGKNSEDFFIEKDTGLLKVAKTIDREIHSKYILYAHVQDGQELLRECVSEVFITVLDLNDNKPEFLMQQYLVSISEDAEVRTIITKVHATDKDFGINRKIAYTFVEENNYFEICPISGIIKLAQSLDRESIPVFNLSIKAEDSGNPKLFSVVHLIVNVLDINDNPPEFRMKTYVAQVSENTSINTEILRVLATSKDIGINAEVLYHIVGGNEQKNFYINTQTGGVFVNKELDYEKTKTFFLTIQAIDGGTPPLSNLVSVNISILDVNDNKPMFSQNVYRVRIREDITIDEQIFQIFATDEDSQQNSLLRYTIERGDKMKQFTIDDYSGIITVAHSLDRETIANYILEVKVCDHGVPELCNYVPLDIEVLDSNDNPPIFKESNYSVILQENKDLDYIIINFEVSDIDESPNSSPYTFDIRSGNEGRFFRIEQDGTLRTASHFNHQVCDLYILQVRVFDNGTPPLYSDTWVEIKIIEESQYPPIITPLEITVNSLEDDFIGGLLGRVFATDQDKYDTLIFDLAPTNNETFLTKSMFNISRDGYLSAISNIDIGLYRINVTVSDGKFISHAIIKVTVELITSDMVRNSVVIRFRKSSPQEFILSHRKGFIRSIRSVIRCRQKDIIIITLQNTNAIKPFENLIHNHVLSEFHTNNTSTINNLDVVFAVRKQQIVPTSEAYFSSEELQAAIRSSIEEIEDAVNLVIEEIISLICKQNLCVHGACLSRIILNKNEVSTFYTDVISFVTSTYNQSNECQCKQGFDGKNCEEVVNACSSDPCPSQKHCWPADSLKGYQCICPQGYTGQFCEIKSAKCQNSSCINAFTSVSFNGKSYAHYKINKAAVKNSIENQFICSLKIRTLQQTGTILYSSGRVDYHVLEVFNGAIQYRFDLGSGEGIISISSIFISDGDWHSINLERVFNSAKLIVDNKHVSQGSSAGVNGILNIQTNDMFVGAQVKSHPSILGFEDIQRGFIGCMADIKIAKESLPLYISGGSSIAALKRFTNVEFTCDPSNVLIHLGICGAQPCFNNGICTDLDNNNFKCTCLPRYTGRICELDLDPCASTPCLFGGRCIFHSPGNYSCSCPLQLSGKRCEYGKFCIPNPCKNGGVCEEGDVIPHCMCRGYTGPTCEIDVNECDNQPCGNGATCINEAGSFRCICPSYLTGASCGDPLYSNSISTKLKNFSVEHITGIVSGITIVFIFVIVTLICLLMRKKVLDNSNQARNRKDNFKEANLNSLLTKEKNGKNNPKMSNLEISHRPASYSASANENMFPNNATYVNNLDILRSYGSAGDELENIPFEYQKINRSNQQVNLNSCNLNEIEHLRKQDWSEHLHLRTFTENKLNNEKRMEGGLPLNRLSYLRPGSRKSVQVTVPNVCHLTSTKDYTSNGQYHWDCSDWVRKSQNPLPDITEVPGAEIADSSSFLSNDSNESKPSSSFFMHNIGDIDPTRDLTTLKDDMTSEYIDTELEHCPQPFQLPLLNSNSLPRLRALSAENEDYSLKTGKCEKVYLFGSDDYKNESNSDTSEYLCEIDDSDLESLSPDKFRNKIK